MHILKFPNLIFTKYLLKPLFISYSLLLSEVMPKWLHIYTLMTTAKQLNLLGEGNLQMYLTLNLSTEEKTDLSVIMSKYP